MSHQRWLVACSHNNKQLTCKILQYLLVQNFNEIFIPMWPSSRSLCCSHVCKSCRACPRTTALHCKWTEANGTVLVPQAQQIVGWRAIPQGKLQMFFLCVFNPRLPHWCLLRQFTACEPSPWFGLVLLNFFLSVSLNSLSLRLLSVCWDLSWKWESGGL